MEVHQTEFLQAVLLASVVALVWENARDEARVQASVTPARTAGTQYAALKKSQIAAATPRIEVPQ